MHEWPATDCLSICCSSFFLFGSLRLHRMAMNLRLPALRDEVHRLWRHAKWLEHHKLQLNVAIEQLQYQYTANEPGVRTLMETYHAATQGAAAGGRLPDYGGRIGCIKVLDWFSSTGLKARASFYLEVWWGQTLLHNEDPALRDLAFWTLRFAADYCRSLVWICVSFQLSISIFYFPQVF